MRKESRHNSLKPVRIRSSCLSSTVPLVTLHIDWILLNITLPAKVRYRAFIAQSPPPSVAVDSEVPFASGSGKSVSDQCLQCSYHSSMYSL